MTFHKRLHTLRKLEIVQKKPTRKAEKCRLPGLLQSPLADSNRRPLLSWAPLGNRSQPRATMFGLFPPVRRRRDLQPVASSCSHGAP
jgi:hypothetical protein